MSNGRVMWTISGGQLTWRKFFMYFFSPLRQMLGEYPQLCYDCVLPSSYPVSLCHSMLYCLRFWGYLNKQQIKKRWVRKCKDMEGMNHYLLFNPSYVLFPSWETNSCWTTHISSISQSLNFHFHVHKLPPAVSVLRLMNPIHTLTSCLMSILILTSHL
jgi:hypothetical protein